MQTRVVGIKLANRLGQLVVLGNKPVNGTIIAMQAIANATPDRYKVILG